MALVLKNTKKTATFFLMTEDGASGACQEDRDKQSHYHFALSFINGHRAPPASPSESEAFSGLLS